MYPTLCNDPSAFSQKICDIDKHGDLPAIRVAFWRHFFGLIGSARRKTAQKVLFTIILLYGITIVLGQSAHILLWNQAILPEQNGSLCSSTRTETAVFYSSMVILVMTGMSIGLFQVSGPRVG